MVRYILIFFQNFVILKRTVFFAFLMFIITLKHWLHNTKIDFLYFLFTTLIIVFLDMYVIENNIRKKNPFVVFFYNLKYTKL
jgi:hypothetical protein